MWIVGWLVMVVGLAFVINSAVAGDPDAEEESRISLTRGAAAVALGLGLFVAHLSLTGGTMPRIGAGVSVGWLVTVAMLSAAWIIVRFDEGRHLAWTASHGHSERGSRSTVRRIDLVHEDERVVPPLRRTRRQGGTRADNA